MELSLLKPVKRCSDSKYTEIRQAYLNNLPTVELEDISLLENLSRQGIVVTSLESLALPLNREFIQATEALLPSLGQKTLIQKKQYFSKVDASELVKFPSIFLWGLQNRLLDIIENYLGLPVAYHGCYFRKDFAVPVQYRTRLWHLDKEDRRMVKVIVYLRSVSADGGPFEYIPHHFTSEIKRQLNYRLGTVSDRRMQQVASSTWHKTVLGPAGSVIIFDPARSFHRGKVSSDRDRYSIFFDYTSRIPERLYYCKSSFSLEQLEALQGLLSDRQKSCVFWRSG